MKRSRSAIPLQRLMGFTIALLAVFSAPAWAQSGTPDSTKVTWSEPMPPNDQQKSTLQRMINTASVAINGDSDKACFKTDSKTGNFKMKKPSKKSGLTAPATGKTKGKNKVEDDLGLGDPDSTNLGKVKGEWQGLVCCLAEADIMVAENTSEGENEKGVAAEGTFGEGKITIDMEMLDKAGMGMMMDEAGNATPEETCAFLNLMAILVHEGVHNKQKGDVKGEGGNSDASEPAAYEAQRSVLCDLQDWLGDITEGSELNDTEMETLNGLAEGFGVPTEDGGMPRDPEDIAGDVLDNEQFQDCMQNAKSHARKQREAYKDNDNDDDESAAADEGGTMGCYFGDAAGSLEVDPNAEPPMVMCSDGEGDEEEDGAGGGGSAASPPPASSGTTAPPANPIDPTMVGHSGIPIPLASVMWISRWTIGNAATMLICGLNDSGEVELLPMVDTNANGLPDTFQAPVNWGLSSDAGGPGIAAETALADHGGSNPRLWILDRETNTIWELRDTNGDELPDLPTTPFLVSPDLANAARLTHHYLEAGETKLVVRMNSMSSEVGLSSRPVLVATDATSDGVADSSTLGDLRTLFPSTNYTVSLFPNRLDYDDSQPDTMRHGSTEFHAHGTGAVQEMYFVGNLSAQGALIGVTTATGNRLSAEIPLSAAVQGGDFVQVLGLSNMSWTIHVVPSFGNDGVPLEAASSRMSPQEFNDSLWDIDADGIGDFMFADGSPTRIYCGLRNADRTVRQSMVLVGPDGTSKDLVKTNPNEVSFFWSTSYGSDATDAATTMHRDTGSPALGLAHRLGAIDSTTGPDDYIVMTEDPVTGVATLHVGLGQPGGSVDWSGPAVDFSNYGQAIEWKSGDLTGDGLQDILVWFDDLTSAPVRQHLLTWNGSTFDVRSEPQLTVYLITDGSAPGGEDEFTFELYRAPDQLTVNHVLAVGVSGTSPGTTLSNGVHVPLNLDAVSDAILSMGNSYFTENFFGTFGPQDVKGATLRLRDNLLLTTLYAAFVTYDTATGQYLEASNSVEFVHD